jgi:hypothetical protein
MARGSKRFFVLFIGVLSAVLSASALGAQVSRDAAPDFAGLWARQTFGLEAPTSGRGPVKVRPRNAGGGGDYTDPILKPEAAEVVKTRGDIIRSGLIYPTASSQCYPYPPPFILATNQAVQFLQLKDEVVILAMSDHQVRRVRLNGQHPAQLTPSWYGDSIGHYEGDMLVVDTVGIKVTPMASVEFRSGAPYSEALHVIERYRLIDGEAAKEFSERAEKENGFIPADSSTGDGVGVDPNYQGKGLQVEITVDDKGTFTAPWSALVTYRRASGDWFEMICAENIREFGTGRMPPQADKPAF